jgi:hypothetical protein
MNLFERSVWVLFAFMVSIILIVFVFLAERASYSYGIKADDEMGKSIEENNRGNGD